MIERKHWLCLGLGLILRVFLFFQTTIRQYFENSGEFNTPLTSWKRGNENQFENVTVRSFSDRRNSSSTIESFTVHRFNRSWSSFSFTLTLTSSLSLSSQMPISLFFYSKFYTITNGHVEGLFIVKIRIVFDSSTFESFLGCRFTHCLVHLFSCSTNFRQIS